MISLWKKRKSCQYSRVTEKIGSELASSLKNKGIRFTKITINMDEYRINVRLNMLEEFFNTGSFAARKR